MGCALSKSFSGQSKHPEGKQESSTESGRDATSEMALDQPNGKSQGMSQSQSERDRSKGDDSSVDVIEQENGSLRSPKMSAARNVKIRGQEISAKIVGSAETHHIVGRAGTGRSSPETKSQRGEGSAAQSTTIVDQRSRQKSSAKQSDLPNSDHSCQTRNLIPALRLLLDREYKKKKQNTLAVFGHAATQHIRTELADLGWGCGYRNLMMLISALRSDPRLKDRLEEGLSIRWLETTIEKAWKEGYDPLGAQQLNNKLKGTSKWIGTTEVYVLLTYLGIRCTIFDFPEPDKRTGMHIALNNWIRNHFLDDENVTTRARTTSTDDVEAEEDQSHIMCTSRWPIYLQHSGHSRTVVGVEKFQDAESGLFVFDPGRSVSLRLKEFAVEMAKADPNGSQSSNAGSSLASTEPGTPLPGPSRKRSRKSDGPADKTRDDEAGFEGQMIPGKSGRFSKYLNRAFPADPRLLNVFRVSLKTLSKNSEYQCLRIEEDLLLSPEEQLERKNVKSIVIR